MSDETVILPEKIPDFPTQIRDFPPLQDPIPVMPVIPIVPSVPDEIPAEKPAYPPQPAKPANQ